MPGNACTYPWARKAHTRSSRRIVLRTIVPPRGTVTAATRGLHHQHIVRHHLDGTAARHGHTTAVGAFHPVGAQRAGLPPAMPYGGTLRWPDRVLTVIGSRKRIRRTAPSPPRHRPGAAAAAADGELLEQDGIAATRGLRGR